ncbi:MAG: FAD-dependent oxidoreductase [Terrimesophilobacter sp.]
MSTIVIVGSSVGGVRTAQALRANGHVGQIVLIGEESELPYDKPPLSKALLSGAADTKSIRLLTHDAAEAIDVTLLLGHRAVGVDVATRAVQFENHEPITYDKLVVATGASARPSPWGARLGVHVVRTLQDSQQLRADLLKGGPLVVVGAGFIGAEIASTARLLGLEVTVVDPQPVPMSRVFNTEIGKWFVDLHHRHGTKVILGVGVEGIDGERGQLQVRLTDGRILDAATVVVGIGAKPNDEWLEASGLLIDNGLVCDQYCRAIDDSNVFAVGDVARWFHRGNGVDMRAEHWTNAVDQAQCVAHNITRPDDLHAYEPIAYVWSDQYDWKIQVAGRTGEDLGHVIVGDPHTDEKFAALYTDDGQRLAGAATVNWPRALVECRRALNATTDVSVADMHSRLSSAVPVARN